MFGNSEAYKPLDFKPQKPNLGNLST